MDLPTEGHAIIIGIRSSEVDFVSEIVGISEHELIDGKELDREGLNRVLAGHAWKRRDTFTTLVLNADQLSPLLQSGFLKPLEDGRVKHRFIFCVASADRLLPTLRSRCIEVDIQLPSEEFSDDLARLISGPIGGLMAWSANLEPAERSDVLRQLETLVRKRLETFFVRGRQFPGGLNMGPQIRAWELTYSRCSEFLSRATLEALLLSTRQIIKSISHESSSISSSV